MKKLLLLVLLFNAANVMSAAHTEELTGKVIGLGSCNTGPGNAYQLIEIKKSDGSSEVVLGEVNHSNASLSQNFKNNYSTLLLAYTSGITVTLLTSPWGPGTHCSAEATHYLQGVLIGSMTK